MCGLHTESIWEAGVDIHQGRCFGLCGGSGGCGSSVFWRTFLVGDRGGVFRGRLVEGGICKLGGEFVAVAVEVEVVDLEG